MVMGLVTKRAWLPSGKGREQALLSCGASMAANLDHLRYQVVLTAKLH